MKVYYCNIIDKDIYKKIMIPVTKDNQVGLLDILSNKLYRNIGNDKNEFKINL